MLAVMAISAYVTIPRAATPQELAALTAELTDAGLTFEPLTATGERITGAEIVIVAIAVASLNTFFKRLGDEAGKDAYKALKRRITRIRGTTSNPNQGVIVLQDQPSEARLDLTPQLDDNAYQALLELDFTTVPAGTLTWDPETGSWPPASG